MLIVFICAHGKETNWCSKKNVPKNKPQANISSYYSIQNGIQEAQPKRLFQSSSNSGLYDTQILKPYNEYNDWGILKSSSSLSEVDSTLNFRETPISPNRIKIQR